MGTMGADVGYSKRAGVRGVGSGGKVVLLLGI